jgi:DNA-binding response OmpR family regulator
MAVRILVADDDPWILRMVASVLGKRGYDVEVASDGEDALEKALARAPDLLITDVMMPKMDGWTLVKALRARPEMAFLPVVFLTGLSSDDDRIRGFRLGADDYMAKPFRFEELDLRVERTLNRTRMVQQVARERIGAATPPPALSVPVDPEHSEVHFGLMGRLEQVGLSALLTLLEMERKTGELVIVHDSGERKRRPKTDPGGNPSPTGRIYLRGGRVVTARIDGAPDPVNEECVYLLLEWSTGSFEFNACEVTEKPQIQVTTTHLLMEGARRIDESTRSPTDEGWES